MSNNQKKIYIGFDRDGTLEMPGFPMSQELKTLIVEFEKAGASIFFASGKCLNLMMDLSKKIGVNPDFICAENGGHIYNRIDQKESIFGKNADLEIFEQIIKNENLPDNNYEHKVSIWSRKFGDKVLEAGRKIEKIISAKNLRLEVFTYPDGDGGLDVVPPGIDKINLLPLLPDDAEIHYFGDSYNDINIMKSQKVISHTVANAKDIIKEIVTENKGYISKCHAGDGVLAILKMLKKDLQLLSF